MKSLLSVTKVSGDCYLKLSNHSEAMKRCIMALDYFIKTKNQNNTAWTYTSIGTIHEALGAVALQSGNKEEAKGKFDRRLNIILWV